MKKTKKNNKIAINIDKITKKKMRLDNRFIKITDWLTAAVHFLRSI